MEEIGTLIVGAGVVGLAVARELSQTGREVIVVERAARFGTGISARSSEVIHAGLYYPPGSLKARLCVAGSRLLTDYCQRRRIPWRRVGKLVIANGPEQLDTLQRLMANAQRCGVRSLQWLDAPAVRRREPLLRADAAIHSPETGIVDSHALMLALLADAQAAGAILAVGSEVTAVTVRAGGFVVDIGSRDANVRIRTREFINAAGLGAIPLAAGLSGVDRAPPPEPFFAKGSWFAPSGPVPFSHLIYPVPEPGGLGVHLTLDLAGRARFGPDVQWVDQPDYSVDPGRAHFFEERVRSWWPGVPDLRPGDAGVRPKLAGPGRPPADFRIDGPSRHGVPGLVELLGIESPGLTASLAIAEHVRELLEPGSARRGVSG